MRMGLEKHDADDRRAGDEERGSDRRGEDQRQVPSKAALQPSLRREYPAPRTVWMSLRGNGSSIFA
ncbi:MAG TPA: hypothetical protein VIZ58_00425, partial [Thermoanaerobaculia bacterium]